MPFVHQLAEWIAAFDFNAVPEDVQRNAALHVLDSVGCAYGAYGEEAPEATLRAVESLGGKPECTVIGQSWKTSLANAVLANGVLVRTLDLNDLGIGNRAAGHPSDNISVALAAGERQDSSGRDVLGAIVLGYEIYGRVPEGAGEREAKRWDSTTNSGLVAAAMIGRLMGLSVEQLANALALSISHCNTLSIVRRGQLSAAKSVANSMVAHTAVAATLMAAEGVTGPETALEEWRDAVLGGADLSEILAPLNGSYMIMGTSFKKFPSIGTSQTAVEATIRARSGAKIGDADAEIERVEVQMADIPFVRSQVMDPERADPHTRESADHSFPFLVAVALLDGEVTPSQFENDRWFDPKVRSMLRRITITTDPSLNRFAETGGFPSAVRVVRKDGGEYREEVPYHPGHPKNKIGAAGVAAKFNRYAERHLDAGRREQIVRAARELEKARSIRPFLALLGDTI